MHKWFCLGLAAIILCFSGCGKFESEEMLKEPMQKLESSSVSSISGHSDFYIEGLDVDDVILYFNEVVLDAEYSVSGDATVVQKWENEVLYYIHGNPTEQDLTSLKSMVDWLNSIFGFPKMAETFNADEANLNIYFTDLNGMINLMGEQYINNDGTVTFWYDDNKIYSGIICYRTDIDQYTRNSVILEEIYNGMGPIQDTELRTDSIIYSGFSTPQEMTDIDKLIMALLYHPDIECGMTTEECESVIRRIYY